MLTDMRLRALRPTGKIYKVADQQGSTSLSLARAW